MERKTMKAEGIRIMSPFTIECQNCNLSIPKGKKFNAKKISNGLKKKNQNIKEIKFFIKCPNCKSKIIIETCHKNSGYSIKSGGKLMYNEIIEEKKSNLETVNDKELENYNIKKELELIEALDKLENSTRKMERKKEIKKLENSKKNKDFINIRFKRNLD